MTHINKTILILFLEYLHYHILFNKYKLNKKQKATEIISVTINIKF